MFCIRLLRSFFAIDGIKESHVTSQNIPAGRLKPKLEETMRAEDLPYSAERARQMADARSTQNVMYPFIDSTVSGCEAQIEEQITTQSQ